MGKTAAQAIEKDTQVAGALEIAIEGLKGRPAGFNGPAGFMLIMWLNDADRNALLCTSGALSQSTLNQIAGNVDNANRMIQLSHSCMSSSALLNTVGESASALYQRYIEAEEELAGRGLQAVQRCMNILKQKGITPKN